MHAEQVMRQELDRLYPKPVPYIGRTEYDWLTASHHEPGIREQKRLAKLAKEAERKKRDRERLGYEREIMRTPREGGPSAKQIVAAVALAFETPYADILVQKRLKVLVEARHIIAWELRYRKNFSLPRIAEIMGRNHTTVGHSIQHVRKNRHLFEDKIQAVARLLDNQGDNDDQDHTELRGSGADDNQCPC